MASSLPGFDPDGFRTAIRFAMNMGAPPEEERQATFVFPKVQSHTGNVIGDTPMNPNARLTFVPSKPPVRVPCGIEEKGGATSETGVGRFAADRIIVTLLDEDYQTVQGFEFVIYNGLPYRYIKEVLTSGLGPVGVFQVECRSEEISSYQDGAS